MSKYLSFSAISSDSVIYSKAEETIKLNETLINNNVYDSNVCVKSTLITSPAVRQSLSQKAHLSLLQNEEINSIFYQTEMMCLGLRSSVELSTKKKNIDGIADLLYSMHPITTNEIPKESNDPDWIKQLKKEVLKSERKQLNINQEKSFIFNFDPEYGYPVMEQKIKELSNEWTVLQLCKGYNPESTFSTFQQILNYNTGIYISLIRYPRWELNNFKPICIKLKPLEDENIYLKMSQARDQIYPLNVDKSTFHKNVLKVDEDFKQIINLMKKTIGPWICLFHGQHEENIDSKIFSLVDKFCRTNGFIGREIVLITLLARQISILTREDIKQGAEFISSDQTKNNLITLFLIKLKSTEKIILNKKFPVILIIDEYLDYFPWEMIVPSQETTRFGSLQLLIHLNSIYKDSIKNGYLEKKISVANSIINPESNLPDCEKRMTGFFKEIFPSWNIVAGKKLESSEMCSILNKSDLYTYMGHGSGLQLLTGDKISELRIPGIIFLFGCSSVALSGKGFNREMSGSHNYYHLALCPALVGMNYIVTDTAADSLTTAILSDLIYSKSGFKWKQINKEKWRKGEIIYDGVQRESTQNNNLLALLAKNRTDEKQHTLRIRVAFICRGFPIKVVN